MTNYFMETMIDFGFITLFSAAFPIGPAIAIVINMIEIRMKIYSFNSVYRRPLA
jgi:anoctamin-8